MEMMIRFIIGVIGATVLSSCNNFSDCEKNFIEGIGISERAYLTIQDNDKFLTANEVEELLAAMPLNGNDIRERRSIILYVSRVYNRCIKDKAYRNKNNLSGCYQGSLTIRDKKYIISKKRQSKKFSVQELAAAVREKYPQFEGYDDQTLVDAYIKKNPEWSEKVDFGGGKKSDSIDDIAPIVLDDGSYEYSPRNSRKALIRQLRETTGLSKEEVSDDVLAFSAAQLFPKLRESLGVRILEGQQIDLNFIPIKRILNANALSVNPNHITTEIAVDFDLNGYYTEYNREKYYFDDKGVINLRFDEDLSTLESIKAQVQTSFKLEKKHLVYEQIISTYEDNQLRSTKTTSGTLTRVSSSLEGCN